MRRYVLVCTTIIVSVGIYGIADSIVMSRWGSAIIIAGYYLLFLSIVQRTFPDVFGN